MNLPLLSSWLSEENPCLWISLIGVSDLIATWQPLHLPDSPGFGVLLACYSLCTAINLFWGNCIIACRRMMDGAWEGEPNAEQIREFLKMLAVCHTVLPEGWETPQSIKYQARQLTPSSSYPTFCSCNSAHWTFTNRYSPRDIPRPAGI